jgi:hypothetical protein
VVLPDWLLGRAPKLAPIGVTARMVTRTRVSRYEVCDSTSVNTSGIANGNIFASADGVPKLARIYGKTLARGGGSVGAVWHAAGGLRLESTAAELVKLDA